jgi:cardiolipin synthase A/B
MGGSARSRRSVGLRSHLGPQTESLPLTLALPVPIDAPAFFLRASARARLGRGIAQQLRVRQAIRRALKVLIVVALVIAAALAVAQDQETLQLRSAIAAGAPDSPHYLAALAGSPISYGNTFQVLQNGDEIYPAMLDAIRTARERIAFETFMFEDGEVARQFIDALVEAARRGVRVNVIIDDFGSSDFPETYLEQLRDAGCHVRTYNEAKWYQVEEVNYRTHRKIMVVDGATAFTGGVGVADHWLGNAEDPDHWRDTQVRMDGPVARLLEAAFYENFIEGSGTVTPVLAPPPAARVQQLPPDAPARPAGTSSPRTAVHGTSGSADATDGTDTDVATATGAATLVVRSSASGGTSDLKRLYLLLIASARSTVDIATPYFVSDESSRWALQDAVARGVRVRILTEGDITDAPPVKYSSRRSYQQLLDAGVELYEYQPTMMHTKTMVVDGVWSMFGSANFDNRSLELNDELNVVVQDRGVAGRFAAAFEGDLTRSARLDPQRWRHRPWIDKVREGFWGYWGEIF